VNGHRCRTLLPTIACFALASVAAYDTATAGGFSVREQSTSGLGAAFAGVAAGYDLSSIYWNPAGVSIAQDIESETHVAFFAHQSHMTGTATLEPLFGPNVELPFLDHSSGEILSPAVVAAGYSAMPLNERLSIGAGVNSPFGLVTKPDHDNWAGKFEARTSKLFTLNLNPVMSYKVTQRLAVGVGAQIEYVYASLKSAFPGIGGLMGPNPNAATHGDDIGFGYTVGLLWNPFEGTKLGLGFRSSIDHDIEGDFGVPGLARVGASADLKTPELATASIRQQVAPRLTLLGTVEWSNWSNLSQVNVRARGSDPTFGVKPGDVISSISLNWDDGWFFSGGAEFELNERMTLRSGVAYEVSPIQNPTQRTPRSPDTDRVWVSVGGTYAYSEMISFDLAYSHVFFEDGSIDRATEIPGQGQIRLLGDVDTSTDLIAFSVKVKLGSHPPLLLK
jgi:long-chain fatty acid transport protein